MKMIWVLLLSSTAFAKDALPPMVSVATVTDPAPLAGGRWCGTSWSLHLDEATPLDAINVSGPKSPVTITADGHTFTGGASVQDVTIAGTAKVCLDDVALVVGGTRAAALTIPAAALHALDGTLRQTSQALDACDAAGLATLDFPFTYVNWETGGDYQYRSADALAKACVAWHKQRPNVDLDQVPAPVPDGIFLRFSDLTLRSPKPDRLQVTVAHGPDRSQAWQLLWKDGAWKLLRIDIAQ